MSIILAIFIFGFLIFIHELGHFIVARLCGVKVLEFAIGMGPKLLSWVSKKSGTRYSVRLFPIGGYVSMLGENGMEAVQGENGMKDSDGEETSDSSEKEEKKDSFFVTSEDSESDEDNSQDKPRLTEEEAKHAYCNQNVWKRILISLAGPAMNVILGFVLMFVMITLGGKGSIGNTTVGNFHVVYGSEDAFQGMQNGDYLIKVDDQWLNSYAQLNELVSQNPGKTFSVMVERLNEAGTEIEEIILTDVSLEQALKEDRIVYSRSEESGLQIGDKIVKVNGTSVHIAHELSYEISNQGYKPMDLTVVRNGEKIVLKDVIVPNYAESGVTFGSMDFRVWPEQSFDLGTILKHTWYRSCSTVKMVFDSLGGLFSGRYGVEAVSGPIGITKTISEAASLGYEYVLYLVIAISINLGIMNLLPIPGLDGGHLLIYVIEVFRRKPMKKEIEGIINFIGLAAILLLAVLIMIKDIIAL